MGSLLRIAVVAVAAGLVPAAALAQNVYYGLFDLYSLEVPRGWTVNPEGSFQADVAITYTGGTDRAMIQVTLADPWPTLEEDAADTFDGGRITQQRPVEVDGFSCLHVAAVAPNGARQNAVFCKFTVPFEEGPSEVGFMIILTMQPDATVSQEPVFWQVVDSVRFNDIVY